MTTRQKILLSVGVGALAMFDVESMLVRSDKQAVANVHVISKPGSGVPGTGLVIDQPVQVPPGVLNASAQEKLAGLNANDKVSVDTFLANTPGPLDNYLLHLEGMTDLANARYGEPDQASWARALPVARVLEQGMCDCAQRNWLNQFIALGESGLTGDMAKYHAQGEVMATIGRFNGDSVDKQTVMTGGVR